MGFRTPAALLPPTTTPPLAVMGLAAGILVVAWLTAPLPGPPLYDGLGLPAAPYRYLHPPPGAKTTRPPTSAHLTFTFLHQPSPYKVLLTKEQPPQAQLTLEQNAIKTPRGPATITLTIQPVPPPRTPVHGVLDGNVYHFAATAANHVGVLFRNGQVGIFLRGTGMRGRPTIEQYRGDRWRRYSTGTFIGTYSANVSTLGDFALVVSGAKLAASGTTWLPFLVIGSILLGLAVVGIILIRLARSHAENQQQRLAVRERVIPA